MTRWSLLVALVAALMVLSPVQAQPAYLTWDDAPLTLPLRHDADATVRWGWETADKALGPFVQGPFEVGDHTTFLVFPEDGDQEFELKYRSEYAYFWFETGMATDAAELKSAADYFDNYIRVLSRFFYGNAEGPGIDGDDHLHIVHREAPYPGLAGFFSPDDQCAEYICTGSNERDAIYLMLDYGPLNSDYYRSTLAHEYQHLIQFSLDGNEYRWLDEGLSQLAEHMLGFTTDPINSENISSYLAQTDILLNSWSNGYDEQSAYYGAGYLLTTYLYERFGADYIRDLVREPQDGLASIYQTLQAVGVSMNEVLGDWWLANAIDDPYVGDGRYYYQTVDVPEIEPEQLEFRNGAIDRRGLVNQHGADYLEVTRPGTYTLTFTADAETPLTLAAPRSGDWMWWSNNAPASATTLTRTIDLTGVDQATLSYWITGETGSFAGYLHILASADGQHWDLLRAANMADFDGFSEAPGPHYAGLLNGWQPDALNLSDYRDQQVQIRFEYITSNALSGPGFMIDDISIPELGWSDSVEDGDAGWVAEGFMRTQEMVAQDWLLAVVGHEAPDVQRILVEQGGATVQVEVPSGGAVIVVGAMAPFTQLGARYHLRLEP